MTSPKPTRPKIPRTHSAKDKNKAGAYRRMFWLVTGAFAVILALYFVAPKAGLSEPPRNDSPPAEDYSKYWTKEILAEGDGKTYPQKGDTVTIHYTGTLDDGTKFDSSWDRNDPIKIQIGVGRVIPGWEESVPTMSLGERAKLVISHQAGYGTRRVGPIPPLATLNFEVELLGINDKSVPAKEA
ncbi:uncharacterized protein SPPG_02857 [Spizellomyces punctatus DAOM BR117]|uniref:peptidylprolyl isomerase n=1 Tax=Spizellomyces punctatus (strain DAOM BR117) TaxID=645134 RepID=A0A0L0HMT3_SPIPD|nr:uncharacterized protein SPPG_02857 [Spizellomyces punctatus DAOM BR117]KND02388.1 hypothetical protein SPPG_02857 [Spizellomyces punctatus DAOM BR117]|eukprot:XP_016610427.1 hypothetical protein SPPG_02857 [Spizellomyces punctatus DAOM BR117]